MTHKTEVAFALNSHPSFVGPRKYRYHSPIISAEWGGLQDEAWGQNLITFDKNFEKRALETYDLWIKLIEHLPHISWIIDRFHLSTLMYQSLYNGRSYNFDDLENRLVRLGFRLVLCYRDPGTFVKARKARLKISGNPSQYDDLKKIIREQEVLLELVEKCSFPKLIVDASDNDISRMADQIVAWMTAERVPVKSHAATPVAERPQSILAPFSRDPA